MTFVLYLFTFAARAASPEVEIRQVIDQQASAWNRGDIDGFMQTYEASGATAYVGATGVTKGHQNVLARYKKKYTSRDIMGSLRFTDVDIRLLTDSLATVTGQFHLDRGQQAGGNAAGWFTLIVKKTANGWKIIHDHTS